MVMQELIETEATEAIGAARYERNDNRTTHRNGSRSRLLVNPPDIVIMAKGIASGFPISDLIAFLSQARWGGLVRVFLVHHVTWSINSVCHLWGYQSFKGDDESRNNPVFGVLGLGEGWHNNHHAFPTSARQGLSRWQFDASWDRRSTFDFKLGGGEVIQGWWSD